MRLIGIDYGTKRIGVALSDEAGKMAFPKKVFPQTSEGLDGLVRFAKESCAEKVVIGESRAENDIENPLQKDIVAFAGKVRRLTGLPVEMANESFSSFEAARYTGEKEGVDAQAAAVILQRYIDMHMNEENNTPSVSGTTKTQNNGSQEADKAVPAVTVGTAPVPASKPVSYDDFKKVEIRVGKILTAEKVPDTDKLLRLTVDFGEAAPRQIVSGISLYFPDPQTLVGVKVAFAANLESRKIRGLESQGMILAVGGGDKPFSLLRVGDDIAPGAQVN